MEKIFDIIYLPNGEAIVVYNLCPQIGDILLCKIIASTYKIDDSIPLIKLESDELSEDDIHQIAADAGYRMLPEEFREGVIAGYKAALSKNHNNEKSNNLKYKQVVLEVSCSKGGVKREGESCTLNNNCSFPSCCSLEVDREGFVIVKKLI